MVFHSICCCRQRLYGHCLQQYVLPFKEQILHSALSKGLRLLTLRDNPPRFNTVSGALVIVFLSHAIKINAQKRLGKYMRLWSMVARRRFELLSAGISRGNLDRFPLPEPAMLNRYIRRRASRLLHRAVIRAVKRVSFRLPNKYPTSSACGAVSQTPINMCQHASLIQRTSPFLLYI